MTMIRALLTGAATLALAACAAVGPDYASPVPAAPAQADFVSAQSPRFTGDEPPGRWWSLLGDPVLDRLVEEALTANTDLRVASANLAQARAVLREARAGRLPTTNVSAGVTYGRASSATTGGFEADDAALFDVGLDVGYQVDLFGRVRRAIEASEADVGAVQGAFDVARVSVAAETARAYSDACTFGRQIAVARDSVRIQEQTFDLTRRLFEGGRATALETSQAGAQLEQSRSAIPSLEAERRAALYRLSVLTGRPPADFPREVEACATPLSLARPIPVGNGATLLARRPDIRAAERELAAATARIGVATADLYPSITLGGAVDAQGRGVRSATSRSGLSFGFGPLISWFFPNILAARARIQEASADARASLARFDAAVLTALSEVQRALQGYDSEIARNRALTQAVANSRRAFELSGVRVRYGSISQLEQIDVERDLIDSEALLAESDAALVEDQVQVFRTLGGGWQDAPDIDPQPRALIGTGGVRLPTQ
jgi:NodT family efflux transporter outer membrane factor (OMF) lipoprotein